MKQTAVEWLMNEAMKLVVQYMQGTLNYDTLDDVIYELGTKSKEMEKKQLFLASKTSAKEAYEAGQQSMYCGCYDIDGCTSYKEWLYEQFESEQDDNNI
jgi:hypothetical protein